MLNEGYSYSLIMFETQMLALSGIVMQNPSQMLLHIFDKYFAKCYRYLETSIRTGT